METPALAAFRILAQAFIGGAMLGGIEVLFFFQNFEPGLGSGKWGFIIGAIAFPFLLWLVC